MLSLRSLALLATAHLAFDGAVAAHFSGPWDQYIQAPQSRTVQPASVFRTNGSVSTTNKGHLLQGPSSSITFDFGKETAGIPVIQYGPKSAATISTAGLPGFSCSGSCQGLGVGYTEDVAFVGAASDNTGAFTAGDGVLFVPIEQSDYTLPARFGRGGFRYLTLSLSNTTSNNTQVEINGVSVYFTAEPLLTPSELQDYTGYFQSSDELLNKIWYAGVYTAQLCTIGANTSVNDSFPPAQPGWAQDVTIASLNANDMILADGAKRDRSPWSGDLSVSLRTMLVSRNYDSLSAVKNSLISMFNIQDPVSGYFPWGGPPIAELLLDLGSSSPYSAYGSDTYHLYTILGYAQYVQVTGDQAFASKYWPQILKGFQAVAPFIDSSTGLFNGTRTQDWGRGNQGGENTALNALYYATLNYLTQVAPTAGAAVDPKWQTSAAQVKKSANELLYDSKAGFFVDNSTAAGHKIYPQDCNVLAITHNLTKSRAQAQTITANLRYRWTPYGAPTPELPGTISPFISSSELLAQFLANPTNSSNGIALAKLQWGYMLQAFSPDTFVEGYATDGTLNYGFDAGRQSFTSLAHGWSTGPTWSFLEYIVGVRGTPLTPAVERADSNKGGSHWVFQPGVQGSGLTSAKGGYEIPNTGSFEGSWSTGTCTDRGNQYRSQLDMTLSTPSGTTGVIKVPLFGKKQGQVEIQLDGTITMDFTVTKNGGFAKLKKIPGGSHTITLRY